MGVSEDVRIWQASGQCAWGRWFSGGLLWSRGSVAWYWVLGIGISILIVASDPGAGLGIGL